MPGIPFNKAELVALLLESVVFGIFLTFFLVIVAVSCARDPIRLANRRFILIVATVMMAMSIAHLVISFVRVIGIFATGDPQGLPGRESSFADISNRLTDAKELLYGLQTVLGDAVLVWRCYIVYNRSLYVIIPAGVALVGNMILSIPIMVSLFNTAPGTSFFAKGAWQIIGIAIWIIITLCLNLCCTIAIVAKLWRTHRRVSPNYGRSLFPVIAVIIESGALYTAGALSLVISFLARSSGQDVAMDVITPLVGVVFCLIVSQIHFQTRVLKPSSMDTTSSSLPRWGIERRAPTFELRGSVAVHVTQHASTDQESDITPDPKPILARKS